MNFIQTLSFDKSINPLKSAFGWAAPEYHLMGWALSCLQLQKFYTNVDLYCNTQAATLLKGELNLPYSNIYVTHDDLDLINENLWALPKVFTYSLQNAPFIHVDGDVFLFNKLPDSLIQGQLIAQNVEEGTDYYLQTQKELLEHFTYFPDCVIRDFKSAYPIKAVNAGIIGGKNTNFFKEYTVLAFKYIYENEKNLAAINTERFNVFYEQHLFYSLATEKKIPIEFLIKDVVMDNQYQQLGNFHEIPCKKYYLHLLGQYKRDEYTCRQMALKLKQLYPDYYNKIISLFNQISISVAKNVFNKEKFTADKNIYTDEQSKELSTCGYSPNSAINNKTVEINTLSFLKMKVDEIPHEAEISKIEIDEDFACFSNHVKNIRKGFNQYSQNDVYERDLNADTWYCELFGNDLEIADKLIIKCNEAVIIESNFDWAGLLNKHRRVGVKYYEMLEIEKGKFYNLIMPEVYDDGFSLQDIDEMEKIILENLEIECSVKEIFGKMNLYAEEEILQGHLAEYEHLILIMVQSLVIKKAVKPYKFDSQ